MMMLAATFLWLTGCMPAATVRTADVLAPGGVSGGMTWATFAWGAGTSTVEDGGAVVEVSGNSARSFGELSSGGSTVAYAYAAAMAWDLRVGVAPRVELGAQYGFGRIGLETRIAALDEDLGASFSLAPGVLVARQPWQDGAPWFWRLGADVSRRRHWKNHDYLTPAVGLWVSGGERHLQHMLGRAYGYPITDCVEGWPGTPCGTPDPHTRGRVEVERDEITVSMPVSLSLQTLTHKGGGGLTLGLVPQYAVWASTPRITGCTGCRQDVTPLDYRERWMVTVDFGFAGRSTRGMVLD